MESIKEKAKAYDIALDKIKRLLGTGSNCSREELEYVFPELKVSEDDRIRKEIIAFLKYYHTGQGKSVIFDENWIAWLEKQGEHTNFINKIQIGDKVTRNEDGVLVNLSQLNRVAKKDEKQGEQKPIEWSEEDENINECIQWTLIDKQVKEKEPNKYNREIDWLKSLKPQPRQKWSAEDERKITFLTNLIERNFDDGACFSSGDGAKGGYISKLEALEIVKSFRYKNAWRPSERQMKALNETLYHVDDEVAIIISMLIGDLKKLFE